MAKTLSYINTTQRTGSGQGSTSGSAQSSRQSFVGASAGITMSEVVNRFLPVIAENYADAVTQLMPGSYLYNPAFANGAEGWVLSDPEKAYVSVSDDKNRLFLLGGGSVQQVNGRIRKPGKHKEYDFTEEEQKIMPVEIEDDLLPPEEEDPFVPSGELVTGQVEWGEIKEPEKKEGFEEKRNLLYLSFSFVCHKAGTVSIGFVGADESAEDAFKTQTASFQESEEVQTITAQGTWNEEGYFRISLQGEEAQIEVVSLSLTDKPLDEFRKETESYIKQTIGNVNNAFVFIREVIKRITLIQNHINQLYSNDAYLEETLASYGERITAAQSKADDAYSWAVDNRHDITSLQESLVSLTGKVTTLETSLNSLTERVAALEGTPVT